MFSVDLSLTKLALKYMTTVLGCYSSSKAEAFNPETPTTEVMIEVLKDLTDFPCFLGE